MKDILIIAGPTAVGKTEYAIKAALKLNGEIVSADSMQLYKYMNIGSAKPSIEEMKKVPHHLVDEIDPKTRFSAALYQNMAKDAIRDILKRGKTPVISGGTGLYINSLIYEMDFAGESIDLNLRKELENVAEEKGGIYLHDILKELDEEAALRIHPNNIKKMIRAIESVKLSGKAVKSFDKAKVPVKEYTYTLVGLRRERSELYDRINKRVDIMFEAGLIDEVKNLLSMGLDISDISMKGIGYKEVISYLNGEISKEEAVDLIKKNTRHYAKKQITWLKSYENLKWIDLSCDKDENEALEEILKWAKKE